MMDFDGKEMQAEFEAAFGKSINEITVPQMRWLVNVIKHCRGRCRNNTALNNYLNRNFTGLSFKEESVPDKDYTHLSIKERNG